MDPRHNYWRDLLIKPDAPFDTVRRAYRSIARATHADANGGSDDYRVLFESAVNAWKILGNAVAREQYETARAKLLASLDSIQCTGCGEGLRLKRTPRKLQCPLCKTVVEAGSASQSAKNGWSQEQLLQSEVTELLRESGVRLGGRVLDASEQEAERLGRELIQRSGELLGVIFSNGFQLARTKLRRKKGE